MGKEIDPVIRNQCKLGYCIEGRKVPELAQRYGVARTTLYRWKKEDGWDEMKMTRVMSGPMLAHKLKRMILEIVDGAEAEGRPVNSAETERIFKLQLMVDKNDKKARFEAHCIDAMDLLNMYLGERDQALLAQLTPHIMPFLNWVLKHQAAGS